MPGESQLPSLPPRRFLHNPELAKEVLLRVASEWPSERRNWNDLLQHMRDRLQLPKAVLPKDRPRLVLPDVKAPASFRPESVDVPDLQLESIILPLARPALLIQDNDFTVSPIDYWQKRLDSVREQIKRSILAVGRVELKNHDLYEWNGTAWLVRANVAVTNAHVARAFAARREGKWVFRTNCTGKLVSSRVDFREEYQRPAEEELLVTGILYVEENDGPDIALLQIQPDQARGNGLALATQVNANSEVVTIGYPKYDSSVPDPDVLISVFGGIYEVKRLSPGVISEARPNLLKHDCSTLGGSSGSAIIDLVSGQAVGLHFGGSYKICNFAVPAPTVAALLSRFGL